ncbi:MAG: protein kinase [Candidatus Riflebacteria bacterium]|nr:protein kinase [Candidatus Riflebacteria bacterium]
MLWLDIGRELTTLEMKKVIVEDILGEGGQGIVYKVNYDGVSKALKWYFTSKLNNPDEFKENLERNIKKGKPSNSFLWPQDIVTDSEGGFGYIMDLRPNSYNELSEYLVKKARFKSNKAIINAALDICSAFRALHLKGLSYQDLNDGNFFINEETGRVLICDNDNVVPDGDNKTGIQGKCRYMAPEVVLCKTLPNTQSDKFSLAIVLFMLLFRGHPLEGKKTLVPCVTEKHERLFYGENPIFVYDPNNESNRPALGVHNNIIITWKYYPESLKNMFIKAFSQESMKNPNNRIREREWADIFIKLRDGIVNCPYCNDEFFSNTEDYNVLCPNCSNNIQRPGKIECGPYTIPIFVGNKLYHCHAEGLSDEQVDCFKEIGEIILGKSKIEGKPPVVGIRNLSDVAWHTLGDKVSTIEKGGVVRIVRGLEIDLGGELKPAKII